MLTHLFILLNPLGYKMLKNIEKTKMIIDEEPVTNFFQQTSLEHIYIGNIEIALDHLYNGDE